MRDFKCPVKEVRLTSKFGWRDIGRGKEWHQGVDLASPIAGLKVPVFASADGVVKQAGVLSTYGNRVLITHTIDGKTYETNYAHLDKILVKLGQRVKQGEQIGVMGNTGGSFGVHLHFEIHNGLYAPGQPNTVDPMKYINLDDWKQKPQQIEKDDDKMQFTNPTTENAVRDYIKQSVDKKLVDKSWLEKFDNGSLTSGDFEGLKIIISQRINEKC